MLEVCAEQANPFNDSHSHAASISRDKQEEGEGRKYSISGKQRRILLSPFSPYVFSWVMNAA
jgi:hypothetical protein